MTSTDWAKAQDGESRNYPGTISERRACKAGDPSHPAPHLKRLCCPRGPHEWLQGLQADQWLQAQWAGGGQG